MDAPPFVLAFLLFEVTYSLAGTSPSCFLEAHNDFSVVNIAYTVIILHLRLYKFQISYHAHTNFSSLKDCRNNFYKSEPHPSRQGLTKRASGSIRHEGVVYSCKELWLSEVEGLLYHDNQVTIESRITLRVTKTHCLAREF